MSRIAARFRPWTFVWLVILWVGLMGEITWANVFGGVAVAAIIVFGLPLPRMPISQIRLHIGPALKLLATWLVDLLRGSFKVAGIALRPGELPKTAIVRAPMRVDSELILGLATVLYNLQPGGTVTDIDIANREWTVHLLDATTEEDIAREIAAIETLERRLIAAFE